MIRLTWGATAALIISCTTPPDARDEDRDGAAEPNLIALIGRRLSLEYVEPLRNEVRFDSEYRVRVQVLEVVFGEYDAEEMEFLAHVHIGQPPFQDDEFGLVYVSQYEGAYIQQKYLFQPVHRTSDGRWAGCGDPYEGMPDLHRHGVRAEPVTFDPPVEVDIEKEEDETYYKRSRAFEAPFFRVENGMATCLMGNYPRELFRVMAEGYLQARGVTK